MKRFDRCWYCLVVQAAFVLPASSTLTADESPAVRTTTTQTTDSVSSEDAAGNDTSPSSETATSDAAEPDGTTDSKAAPRPLPAHPVATSAKPEEIVVERLLATGNLEGWSIHEGKSETWQLNDGILNCSVPGGGWIRTKNQYDNFILSFAYRLAPGASSGVSIRCPEEGNPATDGIEIQLIDDSHPRYADLLPAQYTGSIYYRVAPLQRAPLAEGAEWNHCRVECSGANIRVWINGQLVNSVPRNGGGATDGSAITPVVWNVGEEPVRGHIAFQSHRLGVQLRDITISAQGYRTESGLAYYDLVPGTGEPVPDDATVTVHYTGSLLNGQSFSSSRKLGNPVTVPLSAVIDGWKEGIPGMRVGGRRQLIVPPNLAYGSAGVKNLIPPDATLIFEVELQDFRR